MARNGSGTFNLPAGNPIDSGSVSNSTTRNNTFTEIATALTDSIARDGQSPATADIPFGTNKLTGVKAGTGALDATNVANIQSGTGVYAATVAGTADVITCDLSPVITAYAAGQRYYFIASAANTGAVTINIDSVGAKAITKNGATVLAAGDIANAAMVTIIYDGTQFQLAYKV